MEREGLVGRGITYAMLLALTLVVGAACGKGGEKDEDPIGHRLRVLGYVFTPDWGTVSTRIPWQGITDLNVAFINPTESGAFQVDPALRDLVNTAHAHQVRIFFSIGGGNPPPYLETLLATAQNRTKLVSGIVDVLNRFGFDGIDVDLENALINEHYASFVEEVAHAVKPLGKLVTAALASWNANRISDATLAHYDFINVMSYDATGPWNPERPGPHSPYSMAVDDFRYFHQTRDIPAARLFVGLPFYGYGFGGGVPESLFFRDIAAQWPGRVHDDEVTAAGGGKVYYNGLITIQQKTQYALDNDAGGVMIWQLLQDAEGAHSLLRAINETINQSQKD